jgi:hypothetical protein
MFEPVDAFKPQTLADFEDWYFKVSLTNLVGDAEVFLFDWESLDANQRNNIVKNHLRDLNKRMEESPKPGWLSDLVPLGFYAHSMPPSTQVMDFSAPHSGTILVHKKLEGLLYCEAADDPRLAVLFPSFDMFCLRPYPTTEEQEFKGMSFDYEVNHDASEGFTYSHIEMTYQMMGQSGIQWLLE